MGTKLEIAFAVKNYDTVGQDCFAMCANDILCHGAKPLFFLDYLACGKLDAEVSSRLVMGIASACEEAGCALVGGETAEMPGFYKDGDYDMAGFCVGVVDKEKIINGSAIDRGDAILGLPSNGLHSNGFSLTRKVLPDYFEEFNGAPLHEELLKPTKVYVTQILELLGGFNIHGMAPYHRGRTDRECAPYHTGRSLRSDQQDLLSPSRHLQSDRFQGRTGRGNVGYLQHGNRVCPRPAERAGPAGTAGAWSRRERSPT